VKPELHPIPIHSSWLHDFVGPISPPSESGNCYITLNDYYTKWVEAVALPTKEASGVANALFEGMAIFLPCAMKS